jgi:hypothetical protein
MTVWRENPHARIVEYRGRWWHENPGDPEWTMLGFAPTPHGPWVAFRHHVLHGLLMHYPLRRVLAWSWRHRRSFS